MLRLIIGLLLFMPCLGFGQPLQGKLLVQGGIQLNWFTPVEYLEGAPLYTRRKGNFGSLFEINYVFKRINQHEFFGGFRWTTCYYEKFELARNAGTGFPVYEHKQSNFQTIAAQFGYRFWLEEATKTKMAAELGILGVHNLLNGFIPNNSNNVYEVSPITPAFRFGHLIRRGWFFCSSSFTWHPLPAFYRSFNWEIPGHPGRPTESGYARMGYRIFQIGFTVGLRL